MCGIWGFFHLHSNKLSSGFPDESKLYNSFLKVKQRGPDSSRFLRIDDGYFLGYHRLNIMGKHDGNQPFIIEMEDRTIYCICNGEIYEHKDIAKNLDIEVNSGSDCEVLIHLYLTYGIEQALNFVKGGEFSFAIVDIFHSENSLERKVDIYLARDPFGVRPLYTCFDSDNIAFSSSLKGLSNIVPPSLIKEFPPGTYVKVTLEKSTSSFVRGRYYSHDYPVSVIDDRTNPDYLEECTLAIEEELTSSVVSMMNSDHPIGALTSGGLDSGIVTAIASKIHIEKYGKPLRTFSVGMPGGTDEKYARETANFCGTEHTHVTFSEVEFIMALDNVIYAIESYDVTTIRASVGQYLLSKWISENTNIKSLLVGDGSDEICSGYLYFHNAPSPKESHLENVRLLKDIHIYDVKRADRGVAENGIETRAPFLKHTFVDEYLSIDPKYRVPRDKQEKWLLRQSFKNYLPESVLNRKKEAFSDGVSSMENPWYKIVQNVIGTCYTDKVFDKYKGKHNPPKTKEAVYYRERFNHFFGNCDHLIPYYWLPKWCGNTVEPSARVLDLEEDCR